MSSTTTMAKSSIWSFAGQSITKFISFVYTVIIARLIMPEEVGAFYLALSVINVIFIFTDFGIDYTVARYVPYLFGKKEFSKLKELVNLSYFGGGGLTLVFTALVFLQSSSIANLVNAPQIGPVLSILSIYLFINELFTITVSILRGRKRIKEMNLINIIQNVAKLLITVPLVYLIGSTAIALSWAFVISFLFALIICSFWIFNEIKKWPKEDKELNTGQKIEFAREVLSFGFVTSLAVALWAIIQYTDKILLAYFNVPLGDIGVYSVAVSFSSLVLLFPSSINSIFLPLVSELHGQGKNKEIKSVIKTSINWVFLSTIPIVIVMVIFSNSLLRMFYGNNYSEGWIVLVCFALGLFVNAIFSIYGNTIAAFRRVDIQLKIMLVVAVTDILLNFLLIPKLGINGAGISAFVSFSLQGLLIQYYSGKIFNLELPRNLYKPLVASLVAFVIIFSIKDQTILLMNSSTLTSLIDSVNLNNGVFQKICQLSIFGLVFVITGFVYLVLLILMKAFTEDDREILSKILKRANFSKSNIIKITNIF